MTQLELTTPKISQDKLDKISKMFEGASADDIMKEASLLEPTEIDEIDDMMGETIVNEYSQFVDISTDVDEISPTDDLMDEFDDKATIGPPSTHLGSPTMKNGWGIIDQNDKKVITMNGSPVTEPFANDNLALIIMKKLKSGLFLNSHEVIMLFAQNAQLIALKKKYSQLDDEYDNARNDASKELIETQQFKIFKEISKLEKSLNALQ